MVELREKVLARTANDFTISEMGLLRFEGWIFVLMDSQIYREILDEAHMTTYSIHLGTTTIYQDLKSLYLWFGMKRDVVDYDSRCWTCQ